MSLVVRALVASAVLVVLPPAHCLADTMPSYGNMKLLFCAYGSIGQQPLVLPPGFENQFAEAVFEVNSSARWTNAPEPFITIYDAAGNAFKAQRVVSVEVFDEPYVEGEGNGAFYMNTDARGHTHAWNRRLSAGMTHLRVRVALATQKDFSAYGGRCRVDFGPQHIDGEIDGAWPTG